MVCGEFLEAHVAVGEAFAAAVGAVGGPDELGGGFGVCAHEHARAEAGAGVDAPVGEHTGVGGGRVGGVAVLRAAVPVALGRAVIRQAAQDRGDGLGRNVVLLLGHQDLGQGGALVRGAGGQQVGVAVGVPERGAGEFRVGVDPGGQEPGGLQGAFDPRGLVLVQAVGEAHQLPQGGAPAVGARSRTQGVGRGRVVAFGGDVLAFGAQAPQFPLGLGLLGLQALCPGGKLELVVVGVLAQDLGQGRGTGFTEALDRFQESVEAGVVGQVPALVPGADGLGGGGAQFGELGLGAFAGVFVLLERVLGACAVGLGALPAGLGGLQLAELCADGAHVVLACGGAGVCGGGQVLAGVQGPFGVVAEAGPFGRLDEVGGQAAGGGVVVFDAFGHPFGLGAQVADLLGLVVDARCLGGELAALVLCVLAAPAEGGVVAQRLVGLQGLDAGGGLGEPSVEFLHAGAGLFAGQGGAVVFGGGLGDGAGVLGGLLGGPVDALDAVAGVGGEVVGVLGGEGLRGLVRGACAVEAPLNGGEVGEVACGLFDEGLVDGAQAAGEVSETFSGSRS